VCRRGRTAIGTVETMPYPTDLLNGDETVVVDLHPHWWFFAGPLSALLASVALGIWLIAWDAEGWFADSLKVIVLALIIGTALLSVIRYLRWSTTSFVVTNARIIFRTGLLAKHGVEIPLHRVNNVNFNQSIIERILGAGDLLIESGGESGQSRFSDIRQPEKVKNLIHFQMQAREARQRDGVQTGDVATQLEKLEGLRDRGSITPEEFDNQKRRLLGG
jgi:uncharacterized membrane protein YdbT with pleckstrin-like domain